MPRTKATAIFWCTPGRSEPRRSTRLQSRESVTFEPKITTNPQSRCILFRLPPELRRRIFVFALSSYEDPGRPRAIEEIKADKAHRDRCHYHPDSLCRRRIDTELLRSCQLIFAETRLLPVIINTHRLCYDSYTALSFPVPSTATRYFSRMTGEHLRHVQSIQFFVHRSRLRSRDPGQHASFSPFTELGYLREPVGSRRQESPRQLGGPLPQTLIITLRHFDWYGWRIRGGYDLDYMLCNKHWENVFGGLKVLKMELEIWEEKKALLEPTIQRLLGFDFDIGEGKSLVPQNASETFWIGPEVGDSGDAPILEDKRFSVTTITWRVREVHESINQGLDSVTEEQANGVSMTIANTMPSKHDALLMMTAGGATVTNQFEAEDHREINVGLSRDDHVAKNDLNAKTPFLRLPQEIKDQIYGLMLAGHLIHVRYHKLFGKIKATTLHPSYGNEYPGSFSSHIEDGGQVLQRSKHDSGLGIDTALLLVCRQVYDEARFVPWSQNTFIFVVSNSGYNLRTFIHLHKNMEHNLAAIRRIGLEFPKPRSNHATRKVWLEWTVPAILDHLTNIEFARIAFGKPPFAPQGWEQNIVNGNGADLQPLLEGLNRFAALPLKKVIVVIRHKALENYVKQQLSILPIQEHSIIRDSE